VQQVMSEDGYAAGRGQQGGYWEAAYLPLLFQDGPGAGGRGGGPFTFEPVSFEPVISEPVSPVYVSVYADDSAAHISRAPVYSPADCVPGVTSSPCLSGGEGGPRYEPRSYAELNYTDPQGVPYRNWDDSPSSIVVGRSFSRSSTPEPARRSRRSRSPDSRHRRRSPSPRARLFRGFSSQRPGEAYWDTAGAWQDSDTDSGSMPSLVDASPTPSGGQLGENQQQQPLEVRPRRASWKDLAIGFSGSNQLRAAPQQAGVKRSGGEFGAVLEGREGKRQQQGSGSVLAGGTAQPGSRTRRSWRDLVPERAAWGGQQQPPQLQHGGETGQQASDEPAARTC